MTSLLRSLNRPISEALPVPFTVLNPSSSPRGSKGLNPLLESPREQRTWRKREQTVCTKKKNVLLSIFSVTSRVLQEIFLFTSLLLRIYVVAYEMSRWIDHTKPFCYVCNRFFFFFPRNWNGEKKIDNEDCFSFFSTCHCGITRWIHGEGMNKNLLKH